MHFCGRVCPAFQHNRKSTRKVKYPGIVRMYIETVLTARGTTCKYIYMNASGFKQLICKLIMIYGLHMSSIPLHLDNIII